MRSVIDWLGEYGDSHGNPTNKLLHWIGVPLIVLAVIGRLGLVAALYRRPGVSY